MQKLAVMALLCGLALVCLGQSGVRAEVLITVDEARLPAPAAAPSSRGVTRGPGIEQESPVPNQSVASPLMLKIKFEPRNNVAIDTATVKLTYLKANPIDLTDRIKRYIRADGIAMDQAEVPPGVHFLRLDLKDVQGRAATAVIKLTVADK
jgi:hypothetical protein